MGLELSQMEKTANGLELNFDLPRKASGDMYIQLNHSPTKIHLNGIEITFEEVLESVFKIPIDFEGHATLVIQ
jgi:hypothetical protein